MFGKGWQHMNETAIINIFWLVVWNMFFNIYWEFHTPN